MKLSTLKKTDRLFKFIRNLILYGIYHLSALARRESNLWIFTSRGVFDGNSKYLFTYTLSNHQEVKCIWIAKKKKEFDEIQAKGLPVLYKWSIEGLKAQLLAGKCFYTIYPTIFQWFLLKGCLRINLWHGVGIKRVEFNIKNNPQKNRFNHSFGSKMLHPRHYLFPDYLLSTSKYISDKMFKTAFCLKEENIINLGYPRCDYMRLSEAAKNSWLKFSDKDIAFRKKLKIYNKVFIYMPTWRSTKAPFMEEAGFNFDEINRICNRKNSMFIFKLHPNTKFDNPVEAYSNILFLNSEIDIYSYLDLTDVLITDYSSIYYEYLLFNDKKILLFPFDKENYLSNDQAFVLNYDDETGGSKCYSYQELIKYVEEPDMIEEQPKELINKYWDNLDLNCCNRLISHLQQSN